MGRRLYDQPAYRAARARLKGTACYWCGQPSEVVDHVRPVAEGGTNERANLVGACLLCNQQRGQVTRARSQKAKKREQGSRRW